MAKDKEHVHLRPQWAGRDILDEAHGPDLDREAALAEFDGKLPRHEAEGKAYGDYKRSQHAKAAAHHLRGIALAHAAGDMREGKKHGLMYQLHLQALGHEPIGPVPREVEQHAKGEDGAERSRVYSFKAHRGDIFVIPDEHLGKKEKEEQPAMTTTPENLSQLDWEFHDDLSGGFYQAMDKSERVLYKTWVVERGGKPSQHVLVKHDGVKQTTLGYFKIRDEVFKSAEETLSLKKNAAHGGGIPLGVPQTAKAENSGIAAIAAAQRVGGKEASEGMGSSSASYGKGSAPWEGSSSSSSDPSHSEASSSSAMDKGSMSASASGSAPAGGGNAGLNAVHAAMRRAEGQTSGEMPFMSMSEKCGKCGSSAKMCKCGNMGKAELCKRCGKAENLCKCTGMGKSEAQQKLADEEKAAHERQYALGKEVLSKVETTGSGPTGTFGVDKDGNPVGTNPAELQERLRNLYVAAKFIVEKNNQ